MAKMDRFITVETGSFTAKTWAERIDRPSGDFEPNDFLGSFVWYRSFRIRYLPELVGVPGQAIKVTDDDGQKWLASSIVESDDRNRYMTLECSHGQMG